MKNLSTLAIVLLLCACAKGARRFETAFLDRETVRWTLQQEVEWASRYALEPSTGTPGFRFLPGSARVLVVAGHATAHMREGRVKVADAGTASLALALNRVAKAPVLLTDHLSASDPNYEDGSAFKSRLAELVGELKPVLVLDLHMSDASRPYDIDFGSARGESLLGREDLLKALASRLKRAGMRNFSRDYFPGAKQKTVSRWVSGLGVPCVQCELNEVWLAPPEAPVDPVRTHNLAQTIEGFTRFIRGLDAPSSAGR